MNPQLEQAFLDDIIAHPDDDTPRLIYADWLDEHDDPRGEFIRVQCALALMHQGDPQREALQSRERHLLYEHGAGWRAALGVGSEAVFRRGFVEVLDLISAATFLEQAEHLFTHTPLQAVWLAQLGPEQLARLGAQPRARQLRFLDLRDNHIGQGGARALTQSQYLDHLETLNLNGNRVTAEAMSILAQANLPCLHTLYLNANPLGDRGATHLAQASFGAQLQTLSLGANLNLPYRERIHAIGMAALAQSMQEEHLRALNLQLQRVGDGGVVSLARAPGSASLRHLNLANNEIGTGGDGGLAALSESPYLSELRTLDLSENPIGSLGMFALAEWPGLARLERLYLNSCNLRDGGVRALLNSPHLRTHTRLFLSGNLLAAETVRQLREQLRDRVEL